MGYNSSNAVFAIFLFIAAGVCAIAGGWLIWKWRRDGWHLMFFFLGCFVLISFGLICTLQRQDFGRTYAAFGGFLIVLAVLWSWVLEGEKPDVWDSVGAIMALVGLCLIMFAPRQWRSVQNYHFASLFCVVGTLSAGSQLSESPCEWMQKLSRGDRLRIWVRFASL